MFDGAMKQGHTGGLKREGNTEGKQGDVIPLLTGALG